jgi:cytochrome c oxidase subunit 2
MMWRKPNRTLTAAAAASSLLIAADAMAEYGLNLPRGVTPISQEAYDLHTLILWVCVAIGVVVFGVMFISIVKHRKSKGAVPAQFHESTAVEIIWTIIPFLILVGMAIPATKALIAMEDTSDSDMTIKVTGYQWKWQYEYLDEGINFFSNLSTPNDQIFDQADKDEAYLLEVDNPVVVPANRKVRLLITAADVIHAWWVPELGMKKDAIPGFVNEMWFKIDEPGVYRGQCAELCGKYHGFMPIVVEAKSEADYNRWVADQKMASAAAVAESAREWDKGALLARGEEVYNTNCAACHQANGQGVPGAFPAIAGSAVAMGPLDAHLDIILNGKPNTAMAAFGPQLSDADLAAVTTYQRNAFGNDTGDVVQPSTVKAAR